MAGAMTWNRSSGSVPAGRAVCAPRPAASAAGVARHSAGAGAARPPAAGRGELAGPEQFGDVLEGAAGGELDDVETAVAEPVAADLGDGRLDRDVGGADRAPGPTAPGQPLDLIGIEQAAPAVGGAIPAQDAAADVGVERGRLDAEPLGGLGGGQELTHAGPACPAAGMPVIRLPPVRRPGCRSSGYHRSGGHGVRHAGTTLRSVLNLINIDERGPDVNRGGLNHPVVAAVSDGPFGIIDFNQR